MLTRKQIYRRLTIKNNNNTKNNYIIEGIPRNISQNKKVTFCDVVEEYQYYQYKYKSY